MDDFNIGLIGSLDVTKSKDKINQDIDIIQKSLKELKLTAKIDTNQIKTLETQLNTLKINLTDVTFSQETLNGLVSQINNALKGLQIPNISIGGSNGFIGGNVLNNDIAKIEEFRKSLSKIGMSSADIDAVVQRINTLGVKITSLNQSLSYTPGAKGKKNLLNIEVGGIDQFGQAVKLTQIWNMDLKQLVKNVDAVSSSTQKTGVNANNFISQQKKAVTDLTNQVNQIYKGAIDPNASKPIKNDANLSNLKNKYNDIITAIDKMGDASAATFADEKNSVNTLISDLKIVIKEYKNAETAATSMRSKDIGTIKSVKTNELDEFIAKIKNSKVPIKEMANEIADLKLSLSRIEDTDSLTAYLNQFDIANSKFKSLKEQFEKNGSLSSVIFNPADLDKQGKVYIQKVRNTIEAIKPELESKLRKAGYTDIEIKGVEDAKGKIKSLTATVTDATGVFKQLNFERAKIQGGGKVQSGFIQTDDVKVIGNISSAVDKVQNNLSSLKAKWEEQGVLVGEFKTKIEQLETSLSSVGSKGELNSLKTQIQELRAEAATISKVNEIQLSMDNGDFDTKILSYETSLQKLGLTADEISEKMKGVYVSYKELKDSASGDNIIPDEVVDKAKILETEMSKLDNVVKQIKLKDSLQADDLQVEQTIIRLNNQLQKNGKYSKEAKDQISAWIAELEKGNVASGTLKRINIEAKELHSNMYAVGKTGQTFVQGIINKTKSLSTYISGTVIVGRLLQSGKQAVDFAKELDKAMTNINYTMDVSSDKLSDIARQSVNTAKDLKTSAENVLAAVTTYANANETAESILSKSKPTIMLSNVTGMDSATTTDILQGTIHQFDLEDTEEELYHVSDVLQAVSKSMAVDFSKGIKEMAEGIQVSGSVANDAGYDLERYSAILGNLIEKTRQSGGELGRSLRTMFVRTTKASTSALAGGEVTEEDLSNAESALRRVGIEVRDSKKEFRDFDAIMTDLYNKIDDLSEVDLSNIAYEVASTRQTAVFKIMVKTWGDYLNLSEKAYGASGETLENQEKYAESLQGKFEGLNSTIESIYSNLANSKDIGQVVDGLQTIADIIDFITEKLGLIGTIGLGAGIAASIKNVGRDKMYSLLC